MLDLLDDLRSQPLAEEFRTVEDIVGSAEVRGLAVLDELSRRSLTRGEPLMHGRRAALAALRVGMFGR